MEDFTNIERQKQDRHDLEQDYADAPLRALADIFPAEGSAAKTPGAPLSGERGDVATRDGGSPSFPPVASPLKSSPVSRHRGSYSPPKRERPHRGGGLA
jgi:hypothetical protein